METCKRCNGEGKTFHKAFDYTYTDGRVEHHADRWDRCYTCDGAGSFPEPDFAAILEAIKGRKGLRAKAPERKDLAGRRAYYVWRLARFHGGADVTLPMTAECISDGDPFRKMLEAVAVQVAERVFGTSRAARARWAPLLGGSPEPTAGLPASALDGGPVVMDGDKPDFEAAELI